MSSIELLNRIRVVLSRPSHPGNIGATARAMKTMGLSRLYLVNPVRFPHAEANALAVHSSEILAQARICQSVEEALAGTVFSVASTTRSRGIAHEILSAREAGERMVNEAARGEVALLMGPEKCGLTAQDVSRCHVISVIPANPDCASLNLAAAVQVFAYEIRQSLVQPLTTEPIDLPAEHQDVERLMAHLENLLYEVQFLTDNHPKKIMQRLRRLFARARLERKEVRILRGVLTEIQRSLHREAQPDSLAEQEHYPKMLIK